MVFLAFEFLLYPVCSWTKMRISKIYSFLSIQMPFKTPFLFWIDQFCHEIKQYNLWFSFHTSRQYHILLVFNACKISKYQLHLKLLELVLLSSGFVLRRWSEMWDSDPLLLVKQIPGSFYTLLVASGYVFWNIKWIWHGDGWWLFKILCMHLLPIYEVIYSWFIIKSKTGQLRCLVFFSGLKGFNPPFIPKWSL